MWSFLAIFIAFLPERWRRAKFGHLGVEWPRATLQSGLLETALAGWGLWSWYFAFSKLFVAEQMALLNKAGDAVPGNAGAMGMGAVMLFAFIVQPRTLALGFFFLEGVTRGLTAATVEECFGTAPLAIVDALIQSGKRRTYEKRVPLIEDLVVPAKGNQEWRYRVESCRPKRDWLYPKTVMYNEEILQISLASWTGAVSKARPHVFLLRPPPPGDVVRAIEPFDPQEVLQTEEEETPNILNLMVQSIREAWRLKRLPLVEDRVLRSSGLQKWDLCVESCRPKREWKYPRTIRFEDTLYRVESIYEVKGPRPFGYKLKRLPVNEAARGVLSYSPDEPLTKT